MMTTNQAESRPIKVDQASRAQVRVDGVAPMTYACHEKRVDAPRRACPAGGKVLSELRKFKNPVLCEVQPLDNTLRHVIAVFVVSSVFSELSLRRDKPAGGEDATSLSITVSARMPGNVDLRPDKMVVSDGHRQGQRTIVSRLGSKSELSSNIPGAATGDGRAYS